MPICVSDVLIKYGYLASGRIKSQGGKKKRVISAKLAEQAKRARKEDDSIRTYQEERIPRTARVQRSARLFGDIIHSDGLTALLRNVIFAGRAPGDFTYTDWFYGYQPERKERSDGH